MAALASLLDEAPSLQACRQQEFGALMAENQSLREEVARLKVLYYIRPIREGVYLYILANCPSIRSSPAVDHGENVDASHWFVNLQVDMATLQKACATSQSVLPLAAPSAQSLCAAAAQLVSVVDRALVMDACEDIAVARRTLEDIKRFVRQSPGQRSICLSCPSHGPSPAGVQQ